MLAMAMLTIACDKTDVPTVEKWQPDPNAMILIKPAKGVQLRAHIAGLTAIEIVEQTENIKWQTQWLDDVYSEVPVPIARGFSDAQIDLEIPALKMWSVDIISQTGEFYKTFIYGTDFYLTDRNNDTIGYVPQGVIDNARALIEAAYHSEDYDEVYRLFDEAFTFLPIAE